MSRDPMKPIDDNEFLKKTTQAANARLNDVRDQVSDLTSKAKDKAGQMADTVSEKLGQQRETAAEGLDRAASTIREKADSVPGGPKVVNITNTLADGMKSTASYLRDHDFNQMGGDVMNLCRRYPSQAVIAALAVGFLLGRSRR